MSPIVAAALRGMRPVAAAAAVWFLGPFVAYDQYLPFASERARLLAIVVIVALYWRRPLGASAL